MRVGINIIRKDINISSGYLGSVWRSTSCAGLLEEGGIGEHPVDVGVFHIFTSNEPAAYQDAQASALDGRVDTRLG